MAQRIVTYCDRHLDEDGDGEQVDATSVVITLDGTERVIDLCPDCDKEMLGELRALLDDAGRRTDGLPTKPRRGRPPKLDPLTGQREQPPRARTSRAVLDLEVNANGNTECPVKGCDAWVQPRSLAHHIRQVHPGEVLARILLAQGAVDRIYECGVEGVPRGVHRQGWGDDARHAHPQGSGGAAGGVT